MSNVHFSGCYFVKFNVENTETFQLTNKSFFCMADFQARMSSHMEGVLLPQTGKYFKQKKELTGNFTACQYISNLN